MLTGSVSSENFKSLKNTLDVPSLKKESEELMNSKKSTIKSSMLQAREETTNSTDI